MEVGDYRLIRVDDWNVEVQELTEKGWEFVGYAGDLANGVRKVFTLTMNKIRRTLKAEDPNHPYLEMYGDVEEVADKVKATWQNAPTKQNINEFAVKLGISFFKK